MERKESTVIVAAVALVLYTLALNAFGPLVSSAITGNKMVSNHGSVQGAGWTTSSNTTVSNNGSMKGVGVGAYSDQACTNAISSINWGTVDPGSNVSRTIYIRNEGNSAATLSIATSNWNPTAASSFMTFTWNYGGETLSVNQVVQVELTLSVSSSIAGIAAFSFDITITASG